MTTVEATRRVTGGVDTHRDVHVAAALDPLGGLLGSESFSTDPAGYKALLRWLRSFGNVTKIGVEGPGSYGAGLARHLRRVGVTVIEVDRPNRDERRRGGEFRPPRCRRSGSGRARGRATGSPKSGDGAIEAIRVLVVAKRSARQARSKALIQMRHLGFSAPEELRCRLKGLSVTALVAEGVKLRRPARSTETVTAATKASLSSLAHRISALDDELSELDERIEALLVATVPRTGGSLRCRAGHRRRTGAGGRRQPRAPPFRSGLGPFCGAVHPSRRGQARRVARSVTTKVVTARRTARSGASSWFASRMTPTPGPTSIAGLRKGGPSMRSSAS